MLGHLWYAPRGDKNNADCSAFQPYCNKILQNNNWAEQVDGFEEFSLANWWK